MSILSCAMSEKGCIVRVAGRGTLKESPAFRAFVQRCLAGHRVPIVIVDLSGCDYLDSTFLGCLIGLHKLAGEGESRLQFFAADNRCARLFSSSMLDRYLNIVDTCSLQATNEFEEIPECALDAREFGRHVMQCHERLAEAGGTDSQAYKSIAAHLAKELEN